MSQDKRHHHRFLSVTMEHVESHPKPLHPVLVEFQDKVEGDTRLYMLFQAMFEEVSGAAILPVASSTLSVENGKRDIGKALIWAAC
jgi:hypothetical protein